MSKTLQFVLIIGSVLFFILLILYSKKMKLKSDYAVIWIVLSLTILLLAIFPQIMFFITASLGIESAANGLYLFFTLLLLILSFFLFIKISILENKISDLSQKLSLERDNKNKKNR